MYPKSVQNLIKAFARLPGVGHRAGERFVFHLLNSGKKEVGEFAIALKELFAEVKSCKECWNFSDNDPCTICSNINRNTDTLCIVEKAQDVEAIEKINFQGKYFVLRGTIKSADAKSLGETKIPELFDRLKNNAPKEIIFALNPNMAGESTFLFLKAKIASDFPQIKISRLARGLPMGADLLYADEITLQNALKNRTE